MPDGPDHNSNPLMTKRVMLKETEVPRATRRVRRGPPRVGQFVPKIAKEANKKFGFSEPHILNYWKDIVGEQLASLASPVKLSRSSGRETNSSGGVLTIRVSGPLGLDLQHMEPQIIGRINSYYGFQAVSRLHIVRGPRELEASKSKRRFGRKVSQTVSSDPMLEASLAEIKDDRLRKALENLGKQIKRRS